MKNYRKIQKQISFAYEDGYKALEWLLEQVNDTPRETYSGYIVKLLLEDKERKESIEK